MRKILVLVTTEFGVYTLHSAKPYEIMKFKHHDEYWRGKGLESQLHNLYLVVLKTDNGKFLHFSGFKTGENAYDLRSPMTARKPTQKICFGTKTVTVIEGGNTNTVLYLYKIDHLSMGGNSKTAIYECFTAYLSHKAWYLHNKYTYPFTTAIILNSISMANMAAERLFEYSDVYCYFDNDKEGEDAYQIIKQSKPAAIDMREYYAQYQDLNEWWVAKLKNN